MSTDGSIEREDGQIHVHRFTVPIEGEQSVVYTANGTIKQGAKRFRVTRLRCETCPETVMVAHP